MDPAFQTYTGNPSLTPTPVAVVGVYKDDGVANFSVSAWAGTVCGNPPMLSVSFREATLTHSLLLSRKEFTVGITGASEIAAVDYLGSRTGRTEDKAATVKWATAKASKVNAPYSPSLSLVYQCKLVESKKLGLHTIFFGEIVELSVRNDVIGEGGVPSLTKLDPVVFSGFEQGYFKLVPGKFAPAFEIYKSLVK
jgi:flavin reductase (DIM6/NTAB) family NADH-FMN oxidoreductase RutF